MTFFLNDVHLSTRRSSTNTMFAAEHRIVTLYKLIIVSLLVPAAASSSSSSSSSTNNKNLPNFQPKNLEPVSKEQLLRAKKQKAEQAARWKEHDSNDHRELFWNGAAASGWEFGEGFDPYLESELMYAPSYNTYNKTSQAYRMLGGYIDCDHAATNQEEQQDDNNGGEKVIGCSRWMMWAAYVAEDDSIQQDRTLRSSNSSSASGSDNLNCGESGSQWRILGVYRLEFNDFLEQMAKHIWSITDARYITALAGLTYITENDCQYVGKDNKGKTLYAGIEPLYGAYFQMALYSDVYCITLSNSGYTYDDFYAGSDMDLDCENDDWTSCTTYNNEDGDSEDRDRELANNNDDNANNYYQALSYNSLDFKVQSKYQAQQVWSAAQEYTLTNMNKVYQEYTKCTHCMNYPTYMNGFLYGTSGYYDDDLINQCWKFYSHSSYTCNGDCQTMALKQKTVKAASPNSTFYATKAAQKYYTNRAFEQDNLIGSTFLLSSAILFVAALASYYCMGGGNLEAMCEGAVDAPCTEGCTDDSEYLGDYDKVDKEPWYKASSKGDDVGVPPPPPPPRPAKRDYEKQALYITPSKTKSMDDDSPSKDALLPTSPVDLDGGFVGNSPSDQYNPPIRFMYSMGE